MDDSLSSAGNGDGLGVRNVFNRLLLAAFIAAALSGSAQAGLFRKTTKPDAASYVPKLIEILKAGTDDHLRVSAASELRDYDAKTFPDLLPTLMNALSSDSSASVRAEAAESIGKVRPVTAEAGYALEQARSNDKSLIVRIAAQRALLHYRILGILGSKEDLVLQTAEPPLASIPANAKATAGSVILRPTPSPVPVGEPVAPPAGPKLVGPELPPDSEATAPKTGSFEPPLAEPKKPVVLTNQPKTPAPLITIPPATKDVIVPVPTSKPTTAGPLLPPPPRE